MSNTSLPALYAIQYSEFDISRGAYIYYEVAISHQLEIDLRMTDVSFLSSDGQDDL
jgi:hypothetical protein